MDSLLDPVRVAAQALVGRTLAEVRCYEMPFGLADTRPWDHDGVHAIDYGVDLVLDIGTVGITWAGYDGFGYGLHVVPYPLLDARTNEVQVAHVDEQEPWQDVVGEEIADTRVHGFGVRWGDRQQVTAPVSLTLTFANAERIALVCAGWNGRGQAVFMTGDDIIVLWRPETLADHVPALADSLLQ